MADVFVMGLLVAFLAGSSADQTGDMLTMHASLGTGFYYFLAYCLFGSLTYRRESRSIIDEQAGVLRLLAEKASVGQLSGWQHIGDWQ